MPYTHLIRLVNTTPSHVTSEIPWRQATYHRVTDSRVSCLAKPTTTHSLSVLLFQRFTHLSFQKAVKKMLSFFLLPQSQLCFLEAYLLLPIQFIKPFGLVSVHTTILLLWFVSKQIGCNAVLTASQSFQSWQFTNEYITILVQWYLFQVCGPFLSPCTVMTLSKRLKLNCVLLQCQI